jgi:hypothetical protein
MALEIALPTTEFGTPAPKAYAKVTSFGGDANIIRVRVSVYFDKDARKKNLTVIKNASHDIKTSQITGALLPGIYDILKTLPEYKDAIDV